MPGATDDRKEWAREWAHLRREFLAGHLLDAVVLPVPDTGGVRWECPVCGELGSTLTNEKQAATAGRNHMQVHVSDEDYEALEDLKVSRMPEHLLTPFQRRRRDGLGA